MKNSGRDSYNNNVDSVRNNMRNERRPSAFYRASMWEKISD